MLYWLRYPGVAKLGIARGLGPQGRGFESRRPDQHTTDFFEIGRRKMKIDKITPCVCRDHVPDCGDSVYYGMPVLTPTINGRFFETKCPVCGRGGLTQHKSAYPALTNWNKLMEHCYRIEGKNIGDFLRPMA